MSSIDRPLRVVQWTTGKVARQSIKMILDRPNLELVGVYAHSKEKHGQDVGDLALKLRVEVLPDDMSLPVEELMMIGFLFPATPVINAIHAVVAARPGIVTYADLPPMTSVLRPKALKNQSITPLVEAPVPAARSSNDSASASSRSVEGTWNVTVKGPTGPQATVLVVERVDGKLTGTQTGQGVTSPIVDVTLEGSTLRWVNHVTKPIKLKVVFTANIDGKTMTGKCKAGFMGSYNFTAIKA